MGLTGAILGDIAGSRFEFKKEIIDWKDCVLFHDECVFTDDTVQSLAIGLAVVDGMDFAKCLRYLCNKYIWVGYGGNFHKWLADSENSPGDSWGNGSAMRVSSIGEVAATLDDALAMAEQSSKCTHNTIAGINGAKAIAGCIYLAKTGAEKKDILQFAQSIYSPENCEFFVGRRLSEYRAEYKFEVSCEKPVPVAIQCFLESEDFETCIRNVFYMNGDTDTLGAMAGSIAESFYPDIQYPAEDLIKDYLDIELFSVWKKITKELGDRTI